MKTGQDIKTQREAQARIKEACTGILSALKSGPKIAKELPYNPSLRSHALATLQQQKKIHYVSGKWSKI